MSKITLTPLANLQNETTAVNAINANTVAIEAAVDNTLSRDGTAPNAMGANLDMNSYPIVNLPLPTSNYEPLRVIDRTTLNAGVPITVSTLPVGGTSGQALVKNSATNYDVTWSTVTGSQNYTSPLTGGVVRTIASKLADVVSVLDFGASNTGADSTTAFNTAIGIAHTIIVPPGTYALSGDIAIPSNTHVWVQKGATITNTGGRFTAAAAGIANVHVQVDGVISFVATVTSPQKLDWPSTVPGGTHRGLIEMGGTQASPGSNLKVTGTGRVYSDYVWAGVPTTYYNFAYQMNRKGISFINSYDCLCEGLEVDHMHGEAIYCNGIGATHSIRFFRNYVHHVAFDALNFNISLSYSGMEIAHNRINNAMIGIEAAAGNVHDNDVETCYKGIVFGGGAGAGPLRIVGNSVISASTIGYDLEFSSSSPVADIIVRNNIAVTSGTTAYILNSVRDFLFINNFSYNHAAIGAGVSFNIASDCARGYITGNTTAVLGAFSTGAFTNNAGGAVTLGTNPTV